MEKGLKYNDNGSIFFESEYLNGNNDNIKLLFEGEYANEEISRKGKE